MPWRSPAFDGRKHHNKLKSLIIVPVWALRKPPYVEARTITIMRIAISKEPLGQIRF